jgi:hypothetical protein
MTSPRNSTVCYKITYRLMATRAPSVFGGVLPYGYNGKGQLFLLLGRENFGRDAGAWSGFAGRMEAVDSGDVLATASREGAEESSGLLGTAADLRMFLDKKAVRYAVENGVHYLLPFQFNSYLPVMFSGVQAAIQSSTHANAHFLEKNAIAWFSVEELTSLNMRKGFKNDIPGILEAIALGRQ